MTDAAAATAMRNLPTQERDKLIIYGTLAGKVIDMRDFFWRMQRRRVGKV